ncbi:MAG: DUF1211 domain-containing protein [Clostridia bacterium]|nr:DUF1211 domain-containing protein [Clostridia bacterium]
MEKNRLEAFSDGVLAIIITIMILELKQPISDGWSDLFALWPTILAYALSYLFIAIYWVNHHIMFHQVKRVNYPILWCNIAWLFVMSFIPFTTAWIGTNPTSFAPVCLYFADMLLACLTSHLLIYFIARENNAAEKFKLGPRSIVSIIIYTLAACFGGFFPIAAFILVAAVSCWWIFPEKRKSEN